MALFRRIRDYAREYRQRQEKARREGYRSYGAKRWAQEAPKREAKQREREAKGKGRPQLSEREQLKRAAIQNYRQQFGTHAKIPTIRKGLRWLSNDELRDAASASRGKLRRLARREPYVQGPDYILNPYWYH